MSDRPGPSRCSPLTESNWTGWVWLLEELETLDRAQIEAALGDLRAAQSVLVGERRPGPRWRSSTGVRSAPDGPKVYPEDVERVLDAHPLREPHATLPR